MAQKKIMFGRNASDKISAREMHNRKRKAYNIIPRERVFKE